MALQIPRFQMDAPAPGPSPEASGLQTLAQQVAGIVQAKRAAEDRQRTRAMQAAQMERQKGLDAADIAYKTANAAKLNQEANKPNEQLVDLGVVEPRLKGVMGKPSDLLEFLAKQRTLNNGGAGNLTPGQKSADEAYGKSYQEWVNSGRTASQKGLAALRSAQARIQAPGGDELSGGWRAALPGSVQPFVSPQREALKQDIQSAVNGTLRATLGAAFTEEEGKRVFAQSWDDRLPVAENVKKLDRTIQEMQDKVSTAEAQAKAFENRGTLKGFRYEGQAQPMAPTIPGGGPPVAPPAPARPAAAAPRYKILSVE